MGVHLKRTMFELRDWLPMLAKQSEKDYFVHFRVHFCVDLQKHYRCLQWAVAGVAVRLSHSLTLLGTC